MLSYQRKLQLNRQAQAVQHANQKLALSQQAEPLIAANIEQAKQDLKKDIKAQKAKYVKQLKRQEKLMASSAQHQIFEQVKEIQTIKKEETAFLNECIR